MPTKDDQAVLGGLKLEIRLAKSDASAAKAISVRKFYDTKR